MDIPEELLRGIYAYGFEKPSAIQQRAIKPTMLGRDLIAQAQSGTVSVSFSNEGWNNIIVYPVGRVVQLRMMMGRGKLLLRGE